MTKEGLVRSPRIALFGLFGIGNIGNDATLLVMLKELSSRLPSAHVLCICPELPELARAMNVTWLPINPVRPLGMWRLPFATARRLYAAFVQLVGSPLRIYRIKKMLGGTHSLLIVGTGVLDDYRTVPWELPSWLLSWCIAATRRLTRLHFVAVGAGPIENAFNRALMTKAIRLADSRSYRDQVSKAFVQGLAVDTHNDPVVPDLVFGLVGPGVPSTAGKIVKTVGLGLIGYFGWAKDEIDGNEIYENYLAKMVRFVVWLLSRGYSLRLMVGEPRTDERAVRDLRAALASELGQSELRNVCAEPIRDVDELLQEIRKVDVVVTSRYHNAICALALGRPVITIGYGSKFEALMEDVGLGPYRQDIEHLDVGQLSAQFETLVAEFDEALGRVAARTSDYRKAVKAHLDVVFSRLGDDFQDPAHEGLPLCS